MRPRRSIETLLGTISALEDLLGASVDEEVLAHRISGHDGGPARLRGR